MNKETNNIAELQKKLKSLKRYKHVIDEEKLFFDLYNSFSKLSVDYDYEAFRIMRDIKTPHINKILKNFRNNQIHKCDIFDLAEKDRLVKYLNVKNGNIIVFYIFWFSRLIFNSLDKIMEIISQRFKKDNNYYFPPGMSLNRFALFVYSKKTYWQIFQPAIQQMQEEYFDALVEKKKWKARWVRLRGYVSFFSAMAAHLPVSGLKAVQRIWTIVG